MKLLVEALPGLRWTPSLPPIAQRLVTVEAWEVTGGPSLYFKTSMGGATTSVASNRRASVRAAGSSSSSSSNFQPPEPPLKGPRGSSCFSFAALTFSKIAYFVGLGPLRSRGPHRKARLALGSPLLSHRTEGVKSRESSKCREEGGPLPAGPLPAGPPSSSSSQTPQRFFPFGTGISTAGGGPPQTVWGPCPPSQSLSAASKAAEAS